MKLENLKEIARDNGVVGAGGAGFPCYAKMSEAADTIILNCVECEPLLKLHRQLLACHTREILSMLDELRAAIGANEAVVGIKSEYRTTVNAVKEILGDFPNIRICETRAVYPMGDEVVLIYEATGRVVRPGGLPIEQNVIVYNVETMYNLYKAVHKGEPVTDKLVSVVGEIDKPTTLRVPIGSTVRDVISMVGRVTVKNPSYLIGGPMMGFIGTENSVITRTTNAIIILEEDHRVISRMNKNAGIEKRRASSSCCQCRTCTDMCPRHALGHPIEPHRVMRAAANSDTSDLSVFINTAYCSGCGVCEKYACPQGLSPKFIIQEFKAGLRKAGIKPVPAEAAPVNPERKYRQLPVHRLAERLNLARYDVDASFSEEQQKASLVRIPLSMHIGAPAAPIVSKGDRVKRGQLIGEAQKGLSVGIHSSIDGVVEEVTEREIVILGER